MTEPASNAALPAMRVAAWTRPGGIRHGQQCAWAVPTQVATSAPMTATTHIGSMASNMATSAAVVPL